MPVDLEDLGVLAVHVDPVDAGEVPDVLRIGVAAMLLRGVLRERRDLALDVPLLEREVGGVRELEVVPRNLVSEHRRALERTQALLRDRLVILVDVVVRRLEDGVRLQAPPRARRAARGCPAAAPGTCARRSRGRRAATPGFRARPSPRAPRARACPARTPRAANGSRSRTRGSGPRPPTSTSRAIVPPQPNSPSSVWGASTSTRFQASIIAGSGITVRLPTYRTLSMDHADTAQLAAVLGALGAALVLLARTRSMLLAGFALLACAEAGLIWSLSGDGGSSLTVGPFKLAAGAAGLVVLALVDRRPRPLARRRPPRSSSRQHRSGSRSTSTRTRASSSGSATAASSGGCSLSTACSGPPAWR